MDTPNRYHPPTTTDTDDRIDWFVVGCWAAFLIFLVAAVVYLHHVYTIWLTLDRGMPQ